MKGMLIAVMALVFTSSVGAATVTVGSTEVQYEGISASEAEALGRIASAARKIYVEDFGFDMPKRIVFHVKRGPDQKLFFYTDCVDGLHLSHPESAGVLGSGTFWGICHEIGHIAFYSALYDMEWISVALGEGWPCYSAYLVVDDLCDAEPDNLWIRPSEYRKKQGIARLRDKLAAQDVDPIWRAAGKWQDLETIIGRKGFAKLFAAWQAANIDQTAPKAKVREVLLALFPDKKKALAEWWGSVSGLFVENIAPSPFKAVSIPADRLTGQPVALFYDDGTCEDKHHSTGSGPAVRFKVPSTGEWYLRSVNVYGARYGSPDSPARSFVINLCDRDMNPIAAWEQQCDNFTIDRMKWTKFEVPPTRVPGDFWIYLRFRSTPAGGVDFGLDKNAKDRSACMALLGPIRHSDPIENPGEIIEKGEWMIRVGLDCPKEADPPVGK